MTADTSYRKGENENLNQQMGDHVHGRVSTIAHWLFVIAIIRSQIII